MIFKQNKIDGSCEILFSDEEKKIINDKQKIFLDAESFRHFGNVLIKMVADWNINFNDEFKSRITLGDEIVEGKDGPGNK
tara:strand:- start:474 stop:713 length:240 start_codon:yes stop_codon:yes gene_type:complete